MCVHVARAIYLFVIYCILFKEKRREYLATYNQPTAYRCTETHTVQGNQLLSIYSPCLPPMEEEGFYKGHKNEHQLIKIKRGKVYTFMEEI
ncbi:hypothetical protein E2320_018952 [Naja naja]|nr:hypothetical protein E2320_018952 [Naja naja]